MAKYDFDNLSLIFNALSDKTRRGILERLIQKPATISELAEIFSFTLPTISKHISVLAGAGLVSQTKDGRARTCEIKKKPVSEAIFWLKGLSAEDRLGELPHSTQMGNEEQEMWINYKNTKSPELREELTKKYLYLVKYVAGRVAVGLDPNIEFNDLVSYGILGLFQSINNYDVQGNTKFETFAVSKIRAAIMDELRKLDWAPRLLRNKARAIAAKAERLKTKYEALESEKINSLLDLSSPRFGTFFSDINATDYSFLNLEKLFKEAGEPNEDKNNAMKDALVNAIDGLDKKEKLMLILYYHENHTLKETAHILGVSESRVREIHTKVVSKIRAGLLRNTNRRAEA